MQYARVPQQPTLGIPAPSRGDHNKHLHSTGSVLQPACPASDIVLSYTVGCGAAGAQNNWHKKVALSVNDNDTVLELASGSTLGTPRVGSCRVTVYQFLIVCHGDRRGGLQPVQ